MWDQALALLDAGSQVLFQNYENGMFIWPRQVRALELFVEAGLNAQSVNTSTTKSHMGDQQLNAFCVTGAKFMKYFWSPLGRRYIPDEGLHMVYPNYGNHKNLFSLLRTYGQHFAVFTG
jgi:hypothetical protein